MTPTAQIASIRQKHWYQLGEQDVRDIISAWDARESALRALVAQWKQEVADAAEACEPDADERAAVWDDCADQLERLLESEP